MSGRSADLVKPASGESLSSDAKRRQRIVWYDTGHWVPADESWQEISAFMAENVKAAQ